MSTENRSLAPALYYLAATRAIDFLVDKREEDDLALSPAVKRPASGQRPSIALSIKRAAGGRA